MPQIDQIADVYASQLFWLVIFFGAIFVVVGLGMLPKIQATIDARDDEDRRRPQGGGGRPVRPPTRWRRSIGPASTRAVRKPTSWPPKPRPMPLEQPEKAIAKADKAIATKVDKATAKIAEARAARAARN